MLTGHKEEIHMVDRGTTQVNVQMDTDLKFKIDMMILQKKREGAKITQNELLLKYITEGLERDESRTE